MAYDKRVIYRRAGGAQTALSVARGAKGAPPVLAGENGIRFPTELAMLGKTLLNLGNITRPLDSTFDPNATLRHYAAHLLRDEGHFSCVELYQADQAWSNPGWRLAYPCRRGTRLRF